MARVSPERIREQIEERSKAMTAEIFGDTKELERRLECAEQIYILLKNQEVLEAMLRADELSAQYVTIQLYRGTRDDAPNMNYHEHLNLVIDRASGPGNRLAKLRCRQVIGSTRALFRNMPDAPYGEEAVRKWARETYRGRYFHIDVTPWSSDRNEYTMVLEGTLDNPNELLIAYGSKVETVLVRIHELFYPVKGGPKTEEPPLDLLGEES